MSEKGIDHDLVSTYENKPQIQSNAAETLHGS